MALQYLLKARFDSVRRDLHEVLSQLTDADLTWAPRDGMNTIGDLLREIACKDHEALAWIRTGVWPDDAIQPTADSVDGIRTMLNEFRAETVAFIDGSSEEELQRPIASPDRWWEALRLTECPIDEVLRNIAAHEWYHTGQLYSYLSIKADVVL